MDSSRNISNMTGRWATYICPSVNESSGTSDVVSYTGFVKWRHMVNGQDVHAVTLKTATDGIAQNIKGSILHPRLVIISFRAF